MHAGRLCCGDHLRGVGFGLEAGLALVDALVERGELADYPLLHATRGDLLHRLGRGVEASEAFRTAVALTELPAELAYLRGRLDDSTTRRASGPIT